MPENSWEMFLTVLKSEAKDGWERRERRERRDGTTKRKRERERGEREREGGSIPMQDGKGEEEARREKRRNTKPRTENTDRIEGLKEDRQGKG